jgi:hypothetical protein
VEAVIVLWTCHFLHWTWQHALLNAVAALPPLIVMRGRRWQLMRFAFFAAPLIALAVRIGFAGEYRGASGLVVAMWVYAGMRNRVLLAAVTVKLAAEALGLTPAHDGFVTVALAHYAGATVAVVIGYCEAVFAASMPDTLMASPSASPLTVTSWPTCSRASFWLSSL